MAISIYLKLPGLTGESTAAGFMGQYHVQSFSWGWSKLSSGAVAVPGPLELTINAQAGATFMMVALCAGNPIGDMLLSVAKSGTAKLEVTDTFQIHNAVLMSQVLTSGDTVAMDLTFEYTKVAWIHTVFGSNGEPISHEKNDWDFVNHSQ